ncbi:hypothetical protein ABIE27_000385 [Paenibacillus sp. 4624]|uniref:hypothetical protein n=1 Tax=Paenibacillus sp. 4624 TaxID=3156453 RepID=UPI003D1FE4E6
MASFEMPNVDGMSSMDELKNAVGKMAKELGWLLNNIDWKNINELNISLNGGASVNIANEGITVNDGTKNTFTVNTAGQVTMTGAKVQSSEDGYPRVEMNPDDTLFGAYSSADNYIQMRAVSVGTGSPQLVLVSPVGSLSLYQQANVSDIYAFNSEARITAQRDIVLTPGSIAYDVIMPFEQVLDANRNTTLFAQLLGKATKGSQTATAGASDGGIPIGTILRKADGGTVQWNGLPSHTHTQN